MRDTKSLSPQTFDEFVGGGKSKEVLRIMCMAAKKSGRSPSHLLLNGQAGLGKTTLARIVANQSLGQSLGTLTELVASNIQQPEQLTGILASLEENSVLFIDEIHQLPLKVEELLYPAMEENPEIPIMQHNFNDLLANIGMAKQKPVRINIKLPNFTFIGATTLLSLVSPPLRSRFSQTITLRPYSVDELTEIVMNASTKMSCQISKKVAFEIALRSRSIARTAIGHLKWIQEFCVATNARPSMEIISRAFALKDIDRNGLNRIDIEYLKVLVTSKSVVGIASIAASLGEDIKSIENTIEPYLLREGYMRKTAKGRAAEQKAFGLFSAMRKLRIA